ncbi:MAG: AmmeMemoRadiSam system protein B [Candidatus Odinarchaeota archaeon]
MVIRKAIVAGSFYPRYKPDLLSILKESFTDNKFGPGEEPKTLNQKQRSIIGGVSPHAGYIYSGCCAAFTFLNLFKEKVPDTVIILGTDHVGYSGVALMDEGEWETPLGNLTIDKELSKKILDVSETIIKDESAFIGFPFGREHNIEVQLPFIKYCSHDKDIKIIPIKISTKKYSVLENLAEDISQAIRSYDKDVVIVASSDMTHREIHGIDGLKKFKEGDQKVIDAFVGLNPSKTLEAALKTTVCGPQTITTLMLICKNLNATKGKLLKYYTSSEKTGNYDGYCVGYFSGIIIK